MKREGGGEPFWLRARFPRIELRGPLAGTADFLHHDVAVTLFDHALRAGFWTPGGRVLCDRDQVAKDTFRPPRPSSIDDFEGDFAFESLELIERESRGQVLWALGFAGLGI